MNRGVPLWIEAAVAALLVVSGVMAIISAIGFVRIKDFFVRMHPPALVYTGGTWSVGIAGVLYFSALESRIVVKPLIIIVVLFITVPVTSLMLARVGLFRKRVAGVANTPPPLTPSSAAE